MNKKRYFACVVASFFATTAALFTLLSVSQGMGPDHLKPIRILNVILQSNQIPSNEYFRANSFTDPQPLAPGITAKNVQSPTSLPSSSSSSPQSSSSSSSKTESKIPSSSTRTMTPSSSRPPLSSSPLPSAAHSIKTSSSKTSTSSAPKSATTLNYTSKSVQPSPTQTSKLPSTIKKVTTKGKSTSPPSIRLSSASPSTNSPPSTRLSSASPSATASPPSASYICPTFSGRLGNNLFQFAAGYGIAAAKNVKFVVGEGDTMNKIFKLKMDNHMIISKTRRECAAAKFRGEARASGFDPNVLKFKADSTYRVGTYLQSWKYFHNASGDLREQLKFRDHIQTKADSTINGVLQKYNTTRERMTIIGIHVRRGDMVNHGFGYQVATKEYFEKAVALFGNYSSPLFIVCTNDLVWSKANIPRNNNIEFVSGNSAEVDMAVLASCDHVITSVGSYGWWAGWLSNGTVTYYKWPAKEGSGLRGAYSADYMDYFYPHWIGL